MFIVISSNKLLSKYKDYSNNCSIQNSEYILGQCLLLFENTSRMPELIRGLRQNLCLPDIFFPELIPERIKYQHIPGDGWDNLTKDMLNPVYYNPITVSQPQRFEHFGPDNSVLWGAVQCTVRC